MSASALLGDTVLRCAITFRVPAAYWLGMQAAWDSFHAWKSLRGTVARVPH
jgi:antitoxin HigA-1